MGKHESLWHSTEKIDSFDRLKKDIKTEVLIIGGGLCGLLTAYSLKEKGVSCVVYEIFTAPEVFSDVRKFLEEKNKEMMAAAPKTRRNEEEEPKIIFVQAEVAMIPQNKITLPEDKIATFEKMIDALEEHDDVQNVYHNVDLPYDDEE